MASDLTLDMAVRRARDAQVAAKARCDAAERRLGRACHRERHWDALRRWADELRLEYIESRRATARTLRERRRLKFPGGAPKGGS